MSVYIISSLLFRDFRDIPARDEALDRSRTPIVARLNDRSFLAYCWCWWEHAILSTRYGKRRSCKAIRPFLRLSRGFPRLIKVLWLLAVLRPSSSRIFSSPQNSILFLTCIHARIHINFFYTRPSLSLILSTVSSSFITLRANEEEHEFFLESI